MRIVDTLGNGLEAADREILLSCALSVPRTYILSHPEYEMNAEQEECWLNFEKRRKSGEPVAYITGTKEFYGRTFSVDPSVLIPRPATEVLIDTTLRILRGEDVDKSIDADTDIVIATSIWGDVSRVKVIADIGTGSGCIGITLALALPDITIIATDTEAAALKVARKNAEHHHVSDRVFFLQGDALEPLASITEPFLVVSNPPYIPSTMSLMKDVQDFEPHSALFSGEQGTDVIERLVQQAKENPLCAGVIMECRKEQASIFNID